MACSTLYTDIVPLICYQFTVVLSWSGKNIWLGLILFINKHFVM